MLAIVLLGAAAIVIVTSAMVVLGSVARRVRAEAPEGLRFVFVVPFRSEDDVLRGTVDRLLAQRTGQRFAVMVVSETGDDHTEAPAPDRADDALDRYAGDRRVWIVRRGDDARPGRSAALNEAFSTLRDTVVRSGSSPDEVVVVVLDPDGRVDRDGLDVVAPHFADPTLGSVQVDVRIDSTRNTFAGRLQDIELAEMTAAIGRGRSRLGSTGFDGNGQFVRLSALMSQGDEPWSDNVDLGVQLVMDGWRNGFCPDVTVSTHAVGSIAALADRRTRWYEGQLRGLALVPDVLRSSIRLREKFAVVRHLLAGAAALVLQSLSVVWFVAMIVLVVADPAGATTALGGARLLLLYLLVFGRAPFVAVAYWRAEPTMTVGRALAYAHAYEVFGYGWWATSIRALLTRGGATGDGADGSGTRDQTSRSRVDRGHDDLPGPAASTHRHLPTPAP